MLKVMTIFGTRPEAIKMAPLVKALQAAPDMEPIVTVTAQHRDMLDQVLNLFNITPDYDLNIMSQGQTLYDVTNRALMGLKDVLEEAKKIEREIIQWRKDLHKIPELNLYLPKTTKYVEEKAQKLGFELLVKNEENRTNTLISVYREGIIIKSIISASVIASLAVLA